jgi:hypothetical protein
MGIEHICFYEVYMQQTLMGIIVGLCIVSFPVLILGVMRIMEAITETIGLLKTIVLQLSKIEQLSMATLSASEHFVEALQNAEQNMRNGEMLVSGETFDDLRRSFENGIKDFEDVPDEEDDEPWKK